MLKKHLLDIREGIRGGRFMNESAVSQGIVLRLLQALAWPTYDTQIVTPEFSLKGRRVDFALCCPRNKPTVFVEVKQIGQSEGADRQLFEYAFHVGIPMAIMTDGQEWHFYLPAEQGHYQERRVYKLDILERDAEESAGRLKRYLAYDAVRSGEAIEAVRKDYRNVAKVRESKRTLPKAWAALVEEPDELLVELLAEKVESLCGYKPGLQTAAAFLADRAVPKPSVPRGRTSRRQPKKKPQKKAKGSARKAPASKGFVLHGEHHNASSAIDVMIQVFEALQRRDSSFCQRFADRKHGSKLRYLAREREDLNPDRPDLVRKSSVQLSSGWWLNKKFSNRDKRKIIKLACDVAGIDFGSELKINLG